MEELVAAEADAWNKGDAHAFSTRCTEDISFTNIIGTSYYGRAAFEERSIKRLCFIRADVATADVNTELRSYAKLPSGIQTGDDGVLRTRLLLVLAKEHEGSPRFTMSPSRHYLFEGNYTGGCEVPRHGTGTASNSEVVFCVPFGTEGATEQRRSCRAASHSFDECIAVITTTGVRGMFSSFH